MVGEYPAIRGFGSYISRDFKTTQPLRHVTADTSNPAPTRYNYGRRESIGARPWAWPLYSQPTTNAKSLIADILENNSSGMNILRHRSEPKSFVYRILGFLGGRGVDMKVQKTRKPGRRPTNHLASEGHACVAPAFCNPTSAAAQERPGSDWQSHALQSVCPVPRPAPSPHPPPRAQPTHPP
jgi:hypothetical protein